MQRVFILVMVLVAGCVDATAFKNAQIFPANMTGNAVLIAASLAGALPRAESINPALVLISFSLGCALASALIHSLKTFRVNASTLVIFLAGVVISLCGIDMLHTGEAFSLPHLLTIGAAMGMQSAAALAMNVSGAGLTTVITSTLTTAISRVMAIFFALCLGRKRDAEPSPILPLLIFSLYLGGAFLGVFHGGLSTAAILLGSGLLLTGTAITAGTLFKW